MYTLAVALSHRNIVGLQEKCKYPVGIQYIQAYHQINDNIKYHRYTTNVFHEITMDESGQ